MPGSIALVLRGDCDYTTKARVAQEGGSAALVMINTEDGSFINDIFSHFFGLSLFYISHITLTNFSLFLKLILLLWSFYRSSEDGLC